MTVGETPGYRRYVRKTKIVRNSFLFQIVLSRFGSGEELSRRLQRFDCSIQDAINSSKHIISEEEFNGFYDSIVKESEGKTKASFLARQRKAPVIGCKGLDDGAPGHCFSSPKAFHEELVRRFDQKNLLLLQDIEQLLLRAANGNHFVIKKTISDIYAERLELQLKMLYDLIKCSNATVPKKQFTKLETLCTVMAENATN